MIFLIIACVALMSGIILMIRFFERYDWTFFLGLLGVPLIVYGGVGLLIFCGHNNLKDYTNQYEKAEVEYRVLQSGEPIAIDIAHEYSEDIRLMNEIIDDSKKYHDHWYLGPFYYEEVSKFEKIPIDDLSFTSTKYDILSITY